MKRYGLLFLIAAVTFGGCGYNLVVQGHDVSLAGETQYDEVAIRQEMGEERGKTVEARDVENLKRAHFPVLEVKPAKAKPVIRNVKGAN